MCVCEVERWRREERERERERERKLLEQREGGQTRAGGRETKRDGERERSEERGEQRSARVREKRVWRPAEAVLQAEWRPPRRRRAEFTFDQFRDSVQKISLFRTKTVGVPRATSLTFPLSFPRPCSLSPPAPPFVSLATVTRRHGRQGGRRRTRACGCRGHARPHRRCADAPHPNGTKNPLSFRPPLHCAVVGGGKRGAREASGPPCAVLRRRRRAAAGLCEAWRRWSLRSRPWKPGEKATAWRFPPVGLAAPALSPTRRSMHRALGPTGGSRRRKGARTRARASRGHWKASRNRLSKQQQCLVCLAVWPPAWLSLQRARVGGQAATAANGAAGAEARGGPARDTLSFRHGLTALGVVLVPYSKTAFRP